jgi:hypothetical protein
MRGAHADVRIIFVAGGSAGVDPDPIPMVDLENQIPPVPRVAPEVVD